MSNMIKSLDTQINKLIDDIANAKDITTNVLLKSQVSFQLTKINFGLKIIERVSRLFDIQGQIEDRLLTEESIKDLSIRELLVMSSVNSKRMDNYFTKMDKILGSMNIRGLENSLLMIAELDKKSNAEVQVDDGTKELTNLSLKLLGTITSMQNKGSPKAVGSDSLTEEGKDASELMDGLSTRVFERSSDNDNDSDYLVFDTQRNEEDDADDLTFKIDQFADDPTISGFHDDSDDD